MVKNIIALALLVICIEVVPALAQAVDPVMSLIAERDRQYIQRFDALEKTITAAVESSRLRFEQQEKATSVALSAVDKSVQAALLSSEKAVTKAEAAAEKRFDSVNEFRNTLKDQQLLLITRSEADAVLKAMDRRITEITDQLNKTAGKSEGAGSVWGWLIGVAGLLMMLAGLLFSMYSRPRVA